MTRLEIKKLLGRLSTNAGSGAAPVMHYQGIGAKEVQYRCRAGTSVGGQTALL